MDKIDKVNYWVTLAEYDLETAKAMLKTERYLYVGFMCHQTIEKALKSFYVFSCSEIPPFTHNLTLLAEKSNLLNNLSDNQKNFLDTLEPLNIEARYPKYIDKIFQSLTKEICIEFITKTEELLKWIKTQR